MSTLSDPDRHAVLADPTRRAVLAALDGASAPLGVRDLADALGLHVNSIREQLRRLEQAGLVKVSRAAPRGRGRPSLQYTRIAKLEDPYRVLANALADQVAALPHPRRAARAAGERWGREAASMAAGRRDGSASDDLAVVHALLDEAGFAPEAVAPAASEIRLRACPFLPFDRRHLKVVCGVHLGFIRGALRELGSPREAIAIEPFVGPDLCIARLSRLPRA
jgi:predicted ArsR family transcriptional regulator